MNRLRSEKDECVILVKALPHLSSNYFETVCCAGVGRDNRWRRLYPVPFRVLAEGQKFTRWSWITYEFTDPRHDGRSESQKVVPESISVSPRMKDGERHKVAARLTRESVAEAEARGETLTLIKPRELTFSWKAKTSSELAIETRKHAALASQTSFLDKPTKPLKPCPYEFSFKWVSEAGIAHRHTCDDWETATAFGRRRETADSDHAALRSLQDTYERDYLGRGMRLALGTHSRRKQQWLLVGVLRVDDIKQPELEL